MKNKGLFGSEKEHKALEYVHNNIDSLGRNEKNYIKSKMVEFNRIIKKAYLIDDKEVIMYLAESIKNCFISKFNLLEDNPRYDKTLITHLKNFIIGKTRQLKFNKGLKN